MTLSNPLETAKSRLLPGAGMRPLSAHDQHPGGAATDRLLRPEPDRNPRIGAGSGTVTGLR